jgi:hypothetical protein
LGGSPVGTTFVIVRVVNFSIASATWQSQSTIP